MNYKSLYELMKSRWIICILVLLPVVLYAWCSRRTTGAKMQAGDHGEPKESVLYFDFNEGPLALIDVLKKRRLVFVVGDAPANWIKKDDVRHLMALIHSEEKCGFTVSTYSSWIPEGGNSTIGREALFLIDGFRRGFYPPAITSNHCDLSAEDAESWYRKIDIERKGG